MPFVAEHVHRYGEEFKLKLTKQSSTMFKRKQQLERSLKALHAEQQVWSWSCLRAPHAGGLQPLSVCTPHPVLQGPWAPALPHALLHQAGEAQRGLPCALNRHGACT